MKLFFNIFLVITSYFSFSTSYSQTCPKVFFNNITFGDSCAYNENTFNLAICYQGIPSGTTIVLDSIHWDFDDGTEFTGNNLSAYHFFNTSGIFHVSAEVFFTVNGISCSTFAFYYSNLGNPYFYTTSGGIQNPQNYCNLTNFATVPYYERYISALNVSLYTNPVGPFYPNSQVGIQSDLTGTNPISVTYSLYIDGVNVVPASTQYPGVGVDLIAPAAYSIGQHVVELITDDSKLRSCPSIATLVFEVLDIDTSCHECFTFKPEPGKRYWISAWVKENVGQVLTYANGKVEVQFVGSGAGALTLSPEGAIIDGWQRVAGEFVVPSGTTEININLKNISSSAQVYFDDIRVHPFNGSMKSYVNDPETFWLTAELDDNNYATFYEYDKEGKLIRIKKETERGIVTIQEGRSSNPKTN